MNNRSFLYYFFYRLFFFGKWILSINFLYRWGLLLLLFFGREWILFFYWSYCLHGFRCFYRLFFLSKWTRFLSLCHSFPSLKDGLWFFFFCSKYFHSFFPRWQSSNHRLLFLLWLRWLLNNFRFRRRDFWWLLFSLFLEIVCRFTHKSRFWFLLLGPKYLHPFLP